MEGPFQILFEKMKLEMQNQTAELKDSITTCIMDKMEEKLSPLMEENKKLKSKIEKLENEIEFLKRKEKDNNIIVFGLEEKETTSSELLQNLKITLKQEINIDTEDYEINKLYRLGHKNRESNKPRPILCSFISNWKKKEILRNKKNLKTIQISEDYSKEVLEKRKILQAQLAEERKKGNIAFLKYDKLVVKENTISQEKRKREPSVSPSMYNNQSKKQHFVLSAKANRTNAFDMMRHRSNSLSNMSAPQNQ